MQWRISKTPNAVSASKGLSQLPRPGFSSPDQTHIRSPPSTAAPISRIRSTGLRRTDPFLTTAFEAKPLSAGSSAWIRPRLIRSRWTTGRRSSVRQTGFITAPSMTMPAVTYFQSATSSFLASATIVLFFEAAAIVPRTRSWNQRLSAESGWCRSHSHASSTIMAGRLRLPAFDTPCS